MELWKPKKLATSFDSITAIQFDVKRSLCVFF
jgi:hypothetical protein